MASDCGPSSACEGAVQRVCLAVHQWRSQDTNSFGREMPVSRLHTAQYEHYFFSMGFYTAVGTQIGRSI